MTSDPYRIPVLNEQATTLQPEQSETLQTATGTLPSPPHKGSSTHNRDDNAVAFTRSPDAAIRITNPTGVASVAAGAVHGSHFSFRVIMSPDADRAIRTARFSVQINVDRTDVYVQEGDTVTLIGNYDSGQNITDPILINHTARIVIWSRRNRLWRATVSVFLFAALYHLGYHWFWAALNKLMVHLRLVDRSILTEIFMLLFSFVVVFLWRAASRYKLPADVKRLTSDWGVRTYQNPTGIVEGVISFSRNRGKLPRRLVPSNNSSLEWVVFRIAVNGPAAEIGDRLVWATPIRKLRGEIRVGDTISVEGDWRTGKINRAGRVVNLSMGQAAYSA